jgi:hypothetical protein
VAPGDIANLKRHQKSDDYNFLKDLLQLTRSKYPIKSSRKYVPGVRLGRPTVST